MRIAPAAPGAAAYGPSGHGSPIDRNGPTVCAGVARERHSSSIGVSSRPRSTMSNW